MNEQEKQEEQSPQQQPPPASFENSGAALEWDLQRIFTPKTDKE